jgi:hypothetical protein
LLKGLPLLPNAAIKKETLRTAGSLMSADEIPDDLRDFVFAHIESIAHLEALLLLRNNPEQDWTAERAAQRLYIPIDKAATALGSLAESGFLVSGEQGYRFSCQTSDLEEMVSRLAQTYREKLIPVTNMIHSKPNRIREFANAFRLRRDD